MNKKLYILTLIISVFQISLCNAQMSIRHQVATPRPADSLDIAYYSKKKWLQAGATAAGINMGVGF